MRQKVGIKRLRKATKRCKRLANRTGITHRVIQEYNIYSIISEDEYQNIYKKYCDSKESDVKLIYTYGKSY